MSSSTASLTQCSTNDLPYYDVAVVGMGLVGLATALGCAHQGLRVALIGSSLTQTIQQKNTHTSFTNDEATEDSWDGRIYAYSPATQALLARLGIWEMLPLHRFMPVREMRIFGDDLKAQLDLSAWQVGHQELAWIGENQSLANILLQACRFQPLIHHINATVTQFSNDDVDGCILQVASAVERATENLTQTIRAGLCVGADGAKSTIRELAGIAWQQTAYQHTAVVANFNCTKSHHGVAHQWFLGDSILALLPLPGNRVSMVWSTQKMHADELLTLADDALSQALASAANQAPNNYLGDFQVITKAQAFPLNLGKSQRLIGQHIVLVGDAAHLVHPLAGQGMNLGMGDVADLLDVLANREASCPIGHSSLLRRYERKRAEPIWQMQQLTDKLYHLFANNMLPIKILRNIGLQSINRMNELKKLLIQQALG